MHLAPNGERPPVQSISSISRRKLTLGFIAATAIGVLESFLPPISWARPAHGQCDEFPFCAQRIGWWQYCDCYCGVSPLRSCYCVTLHVAM